MHQNKPDQPGTGFTPRDLAMETICIDHSYNRLNSQKQTGTAAISIAKARSADLNYLCANATTSRCPWARCDATAPAAPGPWC